MLRHFLQAGREQRADCGRVSHTYLHTGCHESILLMLTGVVAVNTPVALFLDAAFFADTAGPVPTPRTAPSMRRPWAHVSGEQGAAQPAGWRRAGPSGQGRHSGRCGREVLGQCSAHGGLGSRVCPVLLRQPGRARKVGEARLD